MPVERSDHIGAFFELAFDPDLIERFRKINSYEGEDEIAAAADELFAAFAEPNAVIRDAAVLKLGVLCRARGKWARVRIAPLLLDENPRIRAEAVHLLGYLSAEAAQEFHPALLLLSRDPDQEVVQRATQTLDRTGFTCETDGQIPPSVEHAARLLVEAISQTDKSDPSDVDMALKLLRSGSTGEAPFAVEIMRTAIRNAMDELLRA